MIWGEEVKKIQGIRWRESVGNNQNAENKTDMVISIVSEIILTTICMVLFLYSAKIMLAEVFLWGEISSSAIKIIIPITVIISGIMEITSYISPRKRRLINIGILVVGIICLYGYLRYQENYKIIGSGLQKIASLYIEDWNAYFKINIVFLAGEIENVLPALNFVIILVFFILSFVAKKLNKNILMSIAPFIVLISEIAVGYSPKGIGIFLLLAGILLANTLSWKKADFNLSPRSRYGSRARGRYFLWIPVGVLIPVCCIVVNIVGNSSAEKWIEKSDELKELQEKIIDTFSNWSFWDMINGESKEVSLTNDTPVYEHKPVLELKLEKKPQESIYLKGFYADTYTDGTWERDTGAFKDACEEAGYDYKAMSESIANLTVNKLKIKYDKENENNYSFVSAAVIDYLDSTGKTAYFPYFSDVEEVQLDVEGDSLFKKDNSTEAFQINVWTLGELGDSYMWDFEDVYAESWESWYENYVKEKYIKVPEEAFDIDYVVNEVLQMIDDSAYDIMNENDLRIYKANMVAKWLSKNTEYSTNLPELPSGADPIEYFLKVSKKGYCMHYASAAVMLLREIGVPARYVSGYIVSKNDFEVNDNQYETTVLDDQAHAWVEIYLNGIGWAPIEVTKGGGVTGVNRYEEETEDQDVIADSEEVLEEDTEETETLVATPEEEKQTEGTENLEGSGDFSGNQSQPEEKTDIGQIVFKILKILAIIGIIGIFTAAVIYKIRKAKANYRNFLLKQINGKRTRRAIKTINRRIYRKLRLKGKVFKSSITDEAYEKLLKATYTDISHDEWEKYMEIVKAAEFSKNDFSVEEMEFCYYIYEKII